MRDLINVYDLLIQKASHTLSGKDEEDFQYQPMSYFKFQVFATMGAGFQEAQKQQGASSAEFDEIKRMLVETNPYFLMLTALVTVLHSV